jgi:hypothetical protein
MPRSIKHSYTSRIVEGRPAMTFTASELVVELRVHCGPLYVWHQPGMGMRSLVLSNGSVSGGFPVRTYKDEYIRSLKLDTSNVQCYTARLVGGVMYVD